MNCSRSAAQETHGALVLRRARDGNNYSTYRVSDPSPPPRLFALTQRGSDGGLLVDKTMRVVIRSSNPGETPDEEHGGQRSSADAGKPEARSRVGSTTNVSQDAIFAAGDCCRLEWPTRESAHWFQVRLWSQARCAQLLQGSLAMAFQFANVFGTTRPFLCPQ